MREALHSEREYCSSLTCSIQSTTLPSSTSAIAIWLIAVVGAAPCQCLAPGAIHTVSPGRISRTGCPHSCTNPEPAVTINVCPNGWVCHAVRAPGSNVTVAPLTRASSVPWNCPSTRKVPTNHSAGPLAEGYEPLGVTVPRGDSLACPSPDGRERVNGEAATWFMATTPDNQCHYFTKPNPTDNRL
ncbi:hypothetical protein PS906_05304 [Pseudomonas fluorescens]|nr:hypothetical protein PS906_05304 [Pseudomonas fluorescens]